MKDLTLSASPHVTQKNNSTRLIMLDVIIALIPALTAGIVFFGYHVAINAVVCVASCFGFELLFSLILRKDFSKSAVKSSSCFDLSCIVTGLILSLNLPSKIIVDAWNLNVYSGNNVVFSFDTVFVCIIGSLFAIVLVKLLFGGIGKNFANPAASARIFLFLCFGLKAITTTAFASSALAGNTGATWLSGTKPTLSGNGLLDLFLGNRGSAAAGETCMIAIIIGYVYLSVKKVIDFRTPLILLGSLIVFSLIFDGISRNLSGTALIYNSLANVMSGGIAFASVFMATDYSTTPNTFLGNVIFAVGVALFTMLIRTFASYPEGASFAILIMNVFTPLIDKFVYPKPFGYVKPVSQKKTKEAQND